ncbi:MAG: diguanylate cyclase [Firmicutes bacterium]|nr:diguanylate cyclase [Bacillota bacterium]
MSIVLIDRCEETRTMINSFLQEAGYEEIIMIDSIDELSPQVPLSSVDMVIMNMKSESLELLSDLHNNRICSTAPIIVILENHNSAVFKYGFAVGVSDFVFLPLDKEEFCVRVRNALKRKYELERLHYQEKSLREQLRQLKDANQVLQALSSIDSLTQVLNRRAFDSVLITEVRRAAREKYPISLIFIDIDCFKTFNDRFGHQAGDRCLKVVAQTLKATLRRPGDILARFGGDEFVAVLPNTPNEGASIVASKMRSCVEALAIECGENSHRSVTISAGIACIMPDGCYDSERLLELADKALYKAKQAGGNTIKFALNKGAKSEDSGEESEISEICERLKQLELLVKKLASNGDNVPLKTGEYIKPELTCEEMAALMGEIDDEILNEMDEEVALVGVLPPDCKKLFDDSIHLQAMITLTGRILQVNPAWEELLGDFSHSSSPSHIGHIIHQEDWSKFGSVLKLISSEHSAKTVETRCLTDSGSIVWISWQLIYLPEQDLISLVGVDISDSKQVEQKYQCVSKAIENMIKLK